MLNSNPQGLSTDRLKRLRSKSPGTHLIERESGTNINHQNELCLFDNVAVQVKSNLSGRPSFQLVRVIRMRNYGRGHTEYRKPVSLSNAEKFQKRQVITNVYVKNFSHHFAIKRNVQRIYGTGCLVM